MRQQRLFDKPLFDYFGADVADPPRPKTEPEKRDQVLDRLERIRQQLVDVGIATARQIAQSRGQVTSVDVLEAMRQSPSLATKMEEVDPRWIGAVFRRGWRRVGWEQTGSHARPVSIWQLK